MTERLRFFKEAAAEIEHERGWYRGRSHVAEANFLRELDHGLNAVMQNPEMWPHYLGGTRRYVFPKFPCAIIPSRSAPVSGRPLDGESKTRRSLAP